MEAATGTVVRFSGANGYGFITPDDGSEDVFLHASLLDGRYRENVPRGTRVSFEAVQGERGLKAVVVKVISEPPARPAGADDDGLCDVISSSEFSQRITDVLISSVPSITGGQIVEVRTKLLEHARRHGWVED
ncbi:cold shock domain-containing protein [Dactylosporangium sp. NPDC000555]|uniref:cold-shock protein n=1 Tax=Dactylosporangium sp. NPDC000555 TaxID=3154260 RepID=UPI0033291512